MSEKKLEKLIKTMEGEYTPPEGLQEKTLEGILANENSNSLTVLSPFERFIYEKPLRAACIFSVVISGILRAILGNGFTAVLSGIIGIG